MKQLVYLALLIAFCLSIPECQAQTTLPADSGHFTINQGNHPVGRSEFSIQPVKQGKITTPSTYSVTSHGALTLQNTRYSFSASGSLGKDLAILSENLNGVVNGSAVTFAVRSSGGNFVIEISADGRSYRNSLDGPAQTVFFPDFDLSSYEILLALAAAHPGGPISTLIPKQSGILIAATLSPKADIQATLNGTMISVHHTSLTIGSVTSELFYSGANRILEVEIPREIFAVVHDNFQLQAPPPPLETAPNGQQQPKSPQN